MDYISSMFPLETADELFHLCSPTCCHNIQIDKSESTTYLDVSETTTKTEYNRRRRKPSSPSSDKNEDNPNDNRKRKIIHKEIERQRRREMAGLYGSLRSLLPLEYLKGKRSISDHMHEAANYINNLQKNIERLSEIRDGLKELSNSSNKLPDSPLENCSHICQEESAVTVRTCLTGVEIVISTSLRQGLPLSGVLDVLIGEGLSIVSCISTKVNEKLLHTIESEVNEGRTIELSELRQKLEGLSRWSSV